MEDKKIESIIEAILFAAGRPVGKKELVLSLEISEEEIDNIIDKMQKEYENQNRGIEIIKIEKSIMFKKRIIRIHISNSR